MLRATTLQESRCVAGCLFGRWTFALLLMSAGCVGTSTSPTSPPDDIPAGGRGGAAGLAVDARPVSSTAGTSGTGPAPSTDAAVVAHDASASADVASSKDAGRFDVRPDVPVQTDAGGPRLSNPRIMPLGDSITSAWENFNSYRYWLYKQLRSAGYTFDFVGSLSGPLPPNDYDADHEGHYGWDTGGIAANAMDWARRTKPDIVMLHIGTNDVRNPAFNVQRSVQNVRDTIKRIRSVQPKVVVLLAKIIDFLPSETNHSLLPAYNDALAALAGELTTAGSTVIAVDQFTGYDPTVDGNIHPAESGQKKMAARWFEALKPILAP